MRFPVAGATAAEVLYAALNVHVTAPPDGSVAVPGYYLLFVIDGEGVPSVGRFIKIPGRRRPGKRKSAAPEN